MKGRTRPIIIKFLNLADKHRIYNARKKLFEKEPKTKTRISEHFSQETTAARRILGPLVKVAIDA